MNRLIPRLSGKQRFLKTSLTMRSVSSSREESKYQHLPLSTSGPIDCALTGTSLLNTPYLNKGSAFTKEERHDFNLRGLLPGGVQSLEQQVNRAYQQYSTRQDDLAKNTFLTSLNDHNEVLYYRVSLENPGIPFMLTGVSYCKTISRR